MRARDVLEGLSGAAIAGLAFLTPFLRHQRNRWGVDAKVAAREYPGDKIVPEARWSWTHGVEIDAPADAVWPWVAQLGADRGGFYSYQWLENIAGCDLRNTESIHPEWTLRRGDALGCTRMSQRCVWWRSSRRDTWWQNLPSTSSQRWQGDPGLP